MEIQNKELKKKLKSVQSFLKREIELDKFLIAKNRNSSEFSKEIINNYRQNSKQLINSYIENFLWSDIFSLTPQYVLENIISSESFFYEQINFDFIDWLGVIAWYNKAVDFLIEENISKLFRNYSKNLYSNINQVNNLNEKTLNLVVNKWYTLSIGKIFSIIQSIKEWKNTYWYTKTFSDFLERYFYIWDVLLSDEFYNLLDSLVKSELFWEKRHIWKITFEEVKYARTLLVWNLEDKNCIVYLLIKIWVIDF